LQEKRLNRTSLAVLVALLALAVMASAATAATTPEFKPVPTNKKFTGSSGTVTWVWGGLELTCEHSSLTGEITSARKVGSAKDVFTGCKALASGGSSDCAIRSVGAKEGEIATVSLDGELGTTSESSSGVVILLQPESGSSWSTLERNNCTGETKVTGKLAVEVKDLGKKQTTNELVSIAKPVNTIVLDSGKESFAELEAWSTTLELGFSDEVKFEEAVEVT
jgi:hypothetical protein